ncbi:MAG: hypothetical protein ACK4J0_02555 [Candidatus Anstonellaceae archaeon]
MINREIANKNIILKMKNLTGNIRFIDAYVNSVSKSKFFSKFLGEKIGEIRLHSNTYSQPLPLFDQAFSKLPSFVEKLLRANIRKTILDKNDFISFSLSIRGIKEELKETNITNFKLKIYSPSGILVLSYSLNR